MTAGLRNRLKERGAVQDAVGSRVAQPPDKQDIDACRRCPLWKRATQGVAGKGPRRAALMLVGEQPGDEEDRQGQPFVGPAGLLLRRALADAGIDDSAVYITNAVKHFSWEPRGTRRIHKTPTQREIAACQDWLDREIDSVRPAVIVALGATALFALIGHRMAVSTARQASVGASGRRGARRHLSSIRGTPSAGREGTLRPLCGAGGRLEACRQPRRQCVVVCRELLIDRPCCDPPR